MNNFGWTIAKIMSKLPGGSKETLNKYLRKKGMAIGKGTKTASYLNKTEPYLISIGDNVTISHDVDFITHDNSVCKLFGVHNDLYGRITIGDNCFIGAHAIIMYGVTIADNVIVGAGSVVTKSIRNSNVIVAGNPAKIIGDWSSFSEKIEGNVIQTKDLSYDEKKELIQNNYSLISK